MARHRPALERRPPPVVQFLPLLLLTHTFLSTRLSLASHTLNATCRKLGNTCGWTEEDLGLCLGLAAIDGPESYFCLNPNATWYPDANEEKRILIDFHAKLQPILPENPPLWYTMWDPDVSHCLWSRVQCMHGRVTLVEMQDAGIMGTLPASFSRFDHLDGLDFKSSLFAGNIPPEWSVFSGLRYLRLSETEARGPLPSYISSLSNLRELQLSNTFLQAELRPEFSVLTNLAYLSWPYTTSGKLPPEWSALTNMSFLRLNGNWETNITGPLPKEWSTWPAVGVVISNSRITGPLPKEWSSMGRATVVDLARNKLTGTLPWEWRAMTNLVELYLFENQLSGTVPPEWSEMSSLQRLALHDNDLQCPPGKGTFLSTVPPNIAAALEQGHFLDPCPRSDPAASTMGLTITISVLIAILVLMVLFLAAILAGVGIHRVRCKDPSCVHRHPGYWHSFCGHFGLRVDTLQRRCTWCSLWSGETDYEVCLYEIQPYMVPENYVASGGFCRIYRGAWRGRDVALKELLVAGGNGDFDNMFKAEIATHTTVSGSSSFIQLLGVCHEAHSPVLILEFMAGGTLRDCIHNSDPGLTTLKILEIAKQIARGLAYLHRRSLVHRDMKPENILLNINNGSIEAKIADLGLAHKAGSLLDSTVFTQSAGTAGYMAPEQYDGSFTSKVDVYALGVIINECFAREQPYPQYEHYVQVCHAVVMKGERPRLAEDMPTSVQKLVTMCWDDAMKRPSAKEVEIMLESIIDEEIRANDPNVQDASSIPTLEQLASCLAVLSAESVHMCHDPTLQ